MWNTVNKIEENILVEKINESTFQILTKDNIKRGKIILNNSEIAIETKYLSYIKGDVKVINSKEQTKLNGIKDIVFNNRKLLSKHNKTILQGSGEVYLEETDEVLILIELIDEEIIIWDDIFYSCEGEIQIEEFTEKVFIFNEDEYDEKLMLSLKGEGLVLLKLPIKNEGFLIKTKILKDTLFANNNYVILRNNNIKYNIEKFIDSEINVYKGTGELWHIPYKKICLNNFNNQNDE